MLGRKESLCVTANAVIAGLFWFGLDPMSLISIRFQFTFANANIPKTASPLIDSFYRKK